MKNQSSLFNPAIVKNYFKTATRNLSKNKFFTTLNVFGLALGMSLKCEVDSYNNGVVIKKKFTE